MTAFVRKLPRLWVPMAALFAVGAHLFVGAAVEGAHNHSQAAAAEQPSGCRLSPATGRAGPDDGPCPACLYLLNAQSACPPAPAASPGCPARTDAGDPVSAPLTAALLSEHPARGPPSRV